MVVSSWSFGDSTNLMPTAETSERLVGQLGTILVEFFVDTNQISATIGIEFEDLVAVGFGHLGTQDLGGLGVAAFDDGPDGTTRIFLNGEPTFMFGPLVI